MTQFSRTWWGQRFIEALEQFTDSNRLGRGRTYANNGRIKEYRVANGRVEARVRGSVNPYFGVYKEPLYETTVGLSQIGPAEWRAIMEYVAARAGFITRLLLNEVPDDIETAFASVGQNLLPASLHELITDCSCPDYSNPCKHSAGVIYSLAADLDQDPFLLFELRGLSREELRAELERSPLGRILAAELTPADVPIVPSESYYNRPSRQPVDQHLTLSLKDYWTGLRRPPESATARPRATVPALLVKKGGDFPPFWPKNASFIQTMEELYERVRTKQLGSR